MSSSEPRASGNSPYSPESAVADAATELAQAGSAQVAFDRLAGLLRRLAGESAFMSARLESLHRSGAAAVILAEHPAGPTLMLARFPHEAPTPVHNHNSWAVLLVVSGRDRHLRWVRVDEGTEPGQARIRVAEERELEPGDALFLPAPPHDIHSQQGVGGPAWELVLFGTNPDVRPRAYFDPERQTVAYREAFR
jgi:predicted metal-dependent enzyme (double-stranded beta helix superfamily)